VQDAIALQDNQIQNKIYTIRGLQVMMDRDLAELYGVETKRLNEQVKRNFDRFPPEFMFQLTKNEFENWKSQIATSNKELMGLRKMPFAFTEQGVSMLSAVLKSKTAIETSIKIIKSFVEMKKFLSQNTLLFQRLDSLEHKQFHTDTQLEKIFEIIESRDIKPKQGIFYDGQVFDAYVFVADLIKGAKKSIVLVDNYIDESVLTLLSKRHINCSAMIYTKTISKQLQLDLKKHNEQYPPIELKIFKDAHDRFLILDETEIYHIGASLKDLGKKWFAFSKFDASALEVFEKLKGQ
jgi:hypothetical protein